jgi:hypothetical protein
MRNAIPYIMVAFLISLAVWYALGQPLFYAN